MRISYGLALSAILIGACAAQDLLPSASAGGGGGAGGTGCIPTGATLHVPVSDGAGGCTISNITTDAGKNNIVAPGTISGQALISSDATHSGTVIMNGLTSGTVAFVVADVAGTAIAYVMPSTNGAAGQFLKDNGVTTCPTLPASAPAVCHALVWTAATVTGGTCTNQAVRVISTSGVPTCVTITSAYVDTSVAVTNATNTFTGRQDATGAASTAPMQTGTSLPGTCIVGDLYFKSNATAGQNIYECQSTNTWTQQLNSGGGGGGSVFTGSTATNPAFSATPTFSLADVSVKSPVRVEPGALTANVTSVTFTNKAAGAKFSIAWTQDGTGGRTVSYGASATNTCTVDPTASATTTQQFEVAADGSTVNGTGCSSTISSISGPEIAAPGTPTSGNGTCWWDSTNHIWSCKDNNSATVSSTVIPDGGAANNFLQSISAGGVITKAQVSFTNLAGVASTAQIPAVSIPAPGATCTFFANSSMCIATTTATITVPVPAIGYQFCVMNDDNVSTVITLSAIGSSARYENTARTAYGTATTGTAVSGGAVGDFICLLGRDSTHYFTTASKGTWTMN